MNIRNFLQKFWIEISLALLTAASGWIIFHFTSLRFPNDDQFILYRYIRNIISGRGFVYNEGEHILGATTPLFTIIASLAAYIFRFLSVPDVVVYVNILFFSLTSLFLYKTAKLFLPKYFSVIAVLIFILDMTKMIPEGMETPLFLFCLFGFLYCALTERYYWSSAFLALTMLTRPDAGLIAVIAIIYWLHKAGWKMTLRLAMVCSAICLPWLVFSTVYFGSFIPQSLATKLHSKDIVREPSVQGAKVQLAAMSRLYWGKLFDPDNLLLQGFLNLLPFILLVLIAAKEKISRHTWIVFAIPLAYFISFAVSNPVMFPWYISEMEPVWLLLSLVGLYEVYKKIPSTVARVAILIFLVAGPVAYWTSFLTTNSKGSKIPLFQMSQYVKDHMHSGDSIGISNIGIAGYLTDAYIVDFFGLVNDYAVNYYPIKGWCPDASSMYTIPPQLIKDTKPKWIIAGEKEIDPCFYKSGWMQKNYEVAYVVNTSSVWKLKETR